MSVAPGGRLPDDNRATLILGELGALLLEAGLSVTDVRTSLETVRDSSAIDGDDLSFSVLPEMVIVTHTRTGAATVVTATTSDLSFRQAAHASQLVRHVQAGVTSLSDVPTQVTQIRGLVRAHAGLQWIVGSALLSSGLAILFRCSWWAIVVTAVVGALVGVITTVLNRIQGAVAIVPFVATLTATTLVGALAHGAGLTQVPLFAVCAPIAIIVPGALITNALLELTARDIITGTVTLIEKCSGAVEFEAVATEHRWVVHISGGSVGRGDLTPDREAVGHLGSPFGRAEQMPSRPEVCGDAAEGRQEPLRMPRRFEAFHRPFALSGGLMRALDAVVQTPRPPVLHRRHERAVGDLVAAQLVGDQHARHVPQALEQVGWPEGVAPSGSHRSVREPLDSYGSCHLDHQTAGTAVVQTQWAKNRGYWVVTRCHACWNSRRPWNRRYFLRTQRIR